ncbi:glycosyltransferase [Paraglaciecola aquimarina]|uniref:Glycosyltransferase n=1 Tax=Paraglaciecola algarum TaxID=3050085 RepID=A0ABS9D7N6_9ALTE|nr:glycosyltransferase [Paraglaciecola sp. G1-23]MCF2947681.1 glycosyltransferase [Paraglaciecola sp. G1-23]
MQLDVIIEQRFYCCSKKQYWTDNAFPNAFWVRYLTVFSAVNIVARVEHVANPKSDWKRVDGDNVHFVDLPCYIGPFGFVKTFPSLYKKIRSRLGIERKVIYRIPGILSTLYQLFATTKSQKYGAEVVGDPADVFSVGASKSVFRGFFKWLFVKMLKAQCSGATSISYVTEYSLQQRYPPNPKAFHTHYSSIQLTQADYHQRDTYNLSKELKIICIGNLTQPYKGCDFMLESLAQLKELGVNCQLTWIGGGYLLAEMQQLVKGLGIDQQVNFVGNLSDRNEIRARLDQADVFVLSSRQEGLPRVLIESMARSLVCVATNVGGVKELLSNDFIIEKDNQSQLVAQIQRLSGLAEQDLLTIAQTNYQKSLDYQDSVLTQRRESMFKHLLGERS